MKGAVNPAFPGPVYWWWVVVDVVIADCECLTDDRWVWSYPDSVSIMPIIYLFSLNISAYISNYMLDGVWINLFRANRLCIPGIIWAVSS